MIRLYGRGHGFASQARVTHGFKRVLEEHHKLAGFFDLDVLEPSADGATAHTAVFTGPLSLMFKMKFNARHERRLVMVAPNSTEIGAAMQESLHEFATGILTPSNWAKLVLERHLKLPITVVPHGVESGFEAKVSTQAALDSRAALRGNRFYALHLSSSAFERKGTAELVEAWTNIYVGGLIPKDSKLLMVLENDSWLFLRAEELRKVGIHPVARFGVMGMGLSPSSMSTIYRNVHVVVQPSRGEAFGMVPLEARASGTPVVATLCTGHTEHMWPLTPGLVTVEHGEMAPIDDFPGAFAPSVSAAAIQQALVEAYENWPKLARAAQDGAGEVGRGWSWENCLSPWMDELVQAAESEKHHGSR